MTTEDLILEASLRDNLISHTNVYLGMMYVRHNLPISHKGCAKCNSIKPIIDFGDSKSGKFGKLSYCKECNAAISKEYRSNNPVKVNQQKNTYQKTRRVNDQSYSIKLRLRNRLLAAMKTNKIGSSKKYGIDWNRCITKLGNKPNNNIEWHIDHIIPCNAFDFSNPEHPALCFHPDNLRWYPANENINKSDDINFQLIKELGIDWILNRIMV